MSGVGASCIGLERPVDSRRLARTTLLMQAEDGIRGTSVTGVQTCALPICEALHPVGVGVLRGGEAAAVEAELAQAVLDRLLHDAAVSVVAGEHPRMQVGRRSEERRVGTESGCLGWVHRVLG